MFYPIRKTNGFTLIEILLSISLVTVISLLASDSINRFHRMGLGQQHHVHSQAEIQRFLIMLKAEMIQAGYGLDTYHQGLIINNREIKLQIDTNLDQDLSRQWGADRLSIFS